MFHLGYVLGFQCIPCEISWLQEMQYTWTMSRIWKSMSYPRMESSIEAATNIPYQLPGILARYQHQHGGCRPQVISQTYVNQGRIVPEWSRHSCSDNRKMSIYQVICFVLYNCKHAVVSENMTLKLTDIINILGLMKRSVIIYSLSCEI